MVKTHKTYRKRSGRKMHRSRRVYRGGKTRRLRKFYRGGSGMLARSVKPGYPWRANPATWPGAPASLGPSACGITASNHYPVSKWGIPAGVGGPFSPNDPPVSSRNFIGGRRKRRGGKRRTRRQKGGNLIPQNLVNLYREGVAGAQSLALKWQGETFPPSYAPNPLNNQPIDKPSEYPFPNPPQSIQNIYTSAQNTVAQL
tara:strand:+ start:2456 stop:3055 length:600 start_codon:yes stop_codon:yes gene_type:complete